MYCFYYHLLFKQTNATKMLLPSFSASCSKQLPAICQAVKFPSSISKLGTDGWAFSLPKSPKKSQVSKIATLFLGLILGLVFSTRPVAVFFGFSGGNVAAIGHEETQDLQKWWHI